MIFGGWSGLHLAKGKSEEGRIEKEDRKELMRLLQTVNDARNTDQTAVRVLFSEMDHYLQNCKHLKMAHKYAWKIFWEAMINICTVNTEQVCENEERIIAFCNTCNKRINMSEDVVIFYEQYAVYHEECLRTKLNDPLALFSFTNYVNSLGIHWDNQKKALTTIVTKIEKKNTNWTIDDLIKQKVKKAKRLLLIRIGLEVHPSRMYELDNSEEDLDSEFSNEQNSN